MQNQPGFEREPSMHAKLAFRAGRKGTRMKKAIVYVPQGISIRT